MLCSCWLGLFASAQQGASPKYATARTTAETRANNHARDLVEAEKVADHFVQRLHETMDFETVYDEFYVRNAVWLYRRADKLNDLWGLSEEMKAGCDDDNLRRVYVAEIQFVWSVMLYYVATQRLDVPNRPDLSPEIFPDDIVQMASTTYYIGPLAHSSLNTPDITSREDLERFISEANTVSKAILERLPNDWPKSRTYRANLKVIDLDRHKSEIRRDTEHLYRSDAQVTVYAVSRDMWRFEFVREQGEFKVLRLQFED